MPLVFLRLRGSAPIKDLAGNQVIKILSQIVELAEYNHEGIHGKVDQEDAL